MPYEPIHHKYRPQTFKDLVGQETIALTLNNALKQERIAPAYLFTGPRGTGKTSSARILAKSLNCLASDRPTPDPCGKCDACRAIARGSALDVMEIDAASNTGVDNIREIIERSRFAPVQCRYKIYAIDECLTGESLIQTNRGLMRIDNPNLKGQQVLSHNEKTKTWEYKKVLRWLNRGVKQTLTITTSTSKIRCTDNHLIRTETGWIEAKNVKEGMKILSPVNVDVGISSINTVQTGEFADFIEDINSRETDTEANPINSQKLSSKQKRYNLSVSVDVKKNSISPISYKKRVEALKVFNLIGIDILIEKVMGFGIEEVKILLNRLKNCNRNNWDLFMELYWGMEVLNIPIHTVDSLVYAGLMDINSNNGWSIRQIDYNNYVRGYKTLLTKDMVKDRQFVIQLVIPSYKKFMKLLDQPGNINLFQWNGFSLLQQKDWRGGIWMMALFNLVQNVIQPSSSTRKGFLKKKTKLFPFGLQIWDTLPTQSHIQEKLPEKPIITSNLQKNLVSDGYRICNNIQFHQWNTSLEEVKSIDFGDCESVYDLEVEDNHNFVANGLLVHNCHMLSTAAFNALLKTLEEPPPQVVFILATTDPQRVLSTIISRCQRFDYRRIPLPEMVGHLKYIAGEENIAIADDALTLVAQIANGGLRDAESLLDQLSLLPDTITVEKVWDLVGAVPEQDLLKLLHWINNNNSLGVLEQCRNLLDRGREPIVVLQNLASFYLNLLIAKTAPQRPDLVAVTETCWQQLCQEAANWDASLILQGQQHLKEAETQLKKTTQPRLWLEVTLLGLLPQAQKQVVISSPQSAIAPVVNPTPPVENRSTNTATKVEPQAIPTSPPPVEKAPEISPVREKKSETSDRPISDALANPLEPVPKSPSPLVSPEPVTPNPPVTATNNFDLEQIWQQAIAAIESRMTQALLEQQCHLVNFDGSSAIVGISSKTLQKLHQNKVPSIEKAFAKAIGNTVKVQLEVVTGDRQTNQTSNPVTDIPSHSVAKAVTPPTAQTKPPTSAANPKPPVSEVKPDFPVTEAKSNQLEQPPVSQPAVSPETKMAMPAIASNPQVSNPPARVESTSDSDTITPPANNVAADLSSNGDGNLAKAIANLTQIFEGELVEMNQDNSGMKEAESGEPAVETLNRPNPEEYDDEW